MHDFNIGDKIVYPNQGVGIIDVIEEKEFNGIKEKYYKIHLINNTMKLSLPLSRLKASNIRLISDSQTLDYNLNNKRKTLEDIKQLAKTNYKERNEMYTSKIKSGTLKEQLEIIYNLTQLKSIHNLNSMEKMILRNTKKILIDEIVQSKKISECEADNLLESYINS
ncbi:CarD family transcriptional regulator [uncultured Clostridium sp.]|uniref:CarD family transcriptional regulator n=1 Tax=uncultured Clostridium sp. TaxID=59620 RepID=UPI0025ED1318|nr:CarD family transcriptional regulator [uncultured Clostridium sp.]